MFIMIHGQKEHNWLRGMDDSLFEYYKVCDRELRILVTTWLNTDKVFPVILFTNNGKYQMFASLKNGRIQTLHKVIYKLITLTLLTQLKALN